MKRKIAKLGAFALFVVSFFFIYGTVGALQLDYITMGQATVRFLIGLAALGYDVWLINHLGEEG